jgi:hypothetical protein
LFSNVVRLVFLSLDQKSVPYQHNQILVSISNPFGIASTLLVLFYWQEIFDKRIMKLSPFLKRLVIPFLIFVALVFLLDLAGLIFISY